MNSVRQPWILLCPGKDFCGKISFTVVFLLCCYLCCASTYPTCSLIFCGLKTLLSMRCSVSSSSMCSNLCKRHKGENKSWKRKRYFPALDLRFVYFRIKIHYQQNKRKESWTSQQSSCGYGQRYTKKNSRSWKKEKKTQCLAKPFIMPNSWYTCWFPWTRVKTSCFEMLQQETGKVGVIVLSLTGLYKVMCNIYISHLFT